MFVLGGSLATRDTHMDKFSAALGARFSLIDDQMLVGLTFTQVIYVTREIDVTLLDGQPSNGYEGVSAGPSAVWTA